MRKIINHPLINAFLSLIIVSGFIHMIILSTQFILTRNLDVFNYFKILDLDFFWKGIHGIPSLIISSLTQILIYVVIWRLYSRKLKK